MNVVIPVSEVREDGRARVGGKAYSLGIMARKGLNVPPAIAVTTEAYDTYIDQTGLRTRIMLELNRKTFDDIRWEELWDISLRIRNLFANTPLPPHLHLSIMTAVNTYFPESSVAVRSSAPGEDTQETSFAGLHSSYINIKGAESIIEHVRLVWASLWSDAALLYRNELGLDQDKSSMAVVIQETVNGDVSGIGFGQNPNDPEQCVIEAVYGLNQGLVDGTLEPDRWIMDRNKGDIISYSPAVRNSMISISETGTALVALPPESRSKSPLSEGNIHALFRLVMKTEEIFGSPQDVEWTIKNGNVFMLQARPITTLSEGNKDDNRGWYLSLKKSFENLKVLREKIEGELIPALQKEIQELSEQDLTLLSNTDIKNEAVRRRAIFEKWKKIYWDYFIPFAHGMRLFGLFYNDTVHPSDPYEFLNLLSTGNILSMQRNDVLYEMASYVRDNEKVSNDLKRGVYTDTVFSGLLQKLEGSFGDLLCRSPHCKEEAPDIVRLALEMSSVPGERGGITEDIHKKEEAFFEGLADQKRKEAAEILDIARASYSMRDNDNIYMGQLKARVMAAEAELLRRSGESRQNSLTAEYFDSLSLGASEPQAGPPDEGTAAGFRLQVRQITGQPAGPGVATGPARVIRSAGELMHFKKGEVLICDAIDPNMTFVVPLASAIVERRGGMLIHGAIIAREYGIPCVTGIKRATEIIRPGSTVTVDGYLGIVIIDTAAPSGIG